VKLAIIILAAVSAFAQTGGDHFADPPCLDIQTGKKTPCKPKPAPAEGAAKREVPPAIDPTAVAVFWKAQAELLAAKLAVVEKDAASAVAASKLTCGMGYQVAPSQAPIGMECAPKPAPPAPAPAKEEPKK